jgi:hypothetical protein
VISRDTYLAKKLNTLPPEDFVIRDGPKYGDSLGAPAIASKPPPRAVLCRRSKTKRKNNHSHARPVQKVLHFSILSATYSRPALVLGKSTSPTAGQRKELDIERIRIEYSLDGRS